MIKAMTRVLLSAALIVFLSGWSMAQTTKPEQPLTPEHPKVEQTKPDHPKADPTKPDHPKADPTKPEHPQPVPTKPDHPKQEHPK